jgi:predicted nucleotidyltransferase
MTDEIVRRFHPLKVVLFGSHARGDAGPDSDVDLLVVMQGVRDKREAAVDIRVALADYLAPKDIIVTTPEEVAARGNVIGGVLRPALREGKVLYEHR